MSGIISWNDAELRGKIDDPRGYSKAFVNEKMGAKHLTMHISVIKPGMRAHDPHQHDGEEIYFILEGEAEVTIEDVAFTVNAYGAIFINGPKMHGIRNSGDGVLKYMVIIGK
ncbi:MAG: cupin domain-containing protein [Candidatus Poribacteria bacterium]